MCDVVLCSDERSALEEQQRALLNDVAFALHVARVNRKQELAEKQKCGLCVDVALFLLSAC